MDLTEMIAAIETELQDATADGDTIERAVVKTVSLMSRLLPKRDIVESRILGDVTSETLTIASSTGTLAVHPVKVGTVAISGKTEGTHFSVNHLTGVVTEIGSGLPDTDYTVSYSRDPRVFDIEEKVSDCIKIERVEYPAGQEPPVNPTFEHVGDFLFFKGKDFSLSESYYLRATYLSAWTPPTDGEGGTDGDYPSHLDNAVIIGSCGQYLIFRAEYYVLQAIAALAALTPPTAYSFVKPTMGAMPDAPTSYTYDKPTSPTLPDAPSAPSAPSLSFTDFETAIGAVGTEITAAKAHHALGEIVINAATRGEDVAATYGRYAEAVFGAANTRANEAIGQLRKIEDELQKYANQVASYGSDVNLYANNVSGLVGKYREEINAEIAGIQDVANDINSYDRQVSGIIAKFQAEVQAENAGINNFIAQVNKYSAQIQEEEMKARNYLDIAGRYLASGQSKINEFLIMLGVKMEFPTTKLMSEGSS